MNNYPDYNVPVYNNLYEFIKFSTKQFGDRIAFELPDTTVTYREFENRVMNLVSHFAEVNRRYIFLKISNPFLFAVAYYAVVISNNIAILYDHKKELPKVFDSLVISIVTDDIIDSFIHTCKKCTVKPYVIESNAVSTILFSSGTSAEPKAVMLTQRNICTNVIAGMQKYLYNVDMRYVNILPYYHAFGLTCDLIAPLYSGGTICILQNNLSFFSELPKLKPNVINVPPIIAMGLLSRIKEKGIIEATGGALRKILCGGAGLSETISSDLRKHEIYAYGCYGISECSPCVTVNRDEYFKDGSAGIPLNCNEVKIASDNEILIKGTNVMKGYFKNNIETQNTIINGWLYTGDLGYFDKKGFLFIIGRKSNTIIFEDGTKCVPETIEKQINVYKDVVESLVYVEKQFDESYLCVKVFVNDTADETDVKNHINIINSGLNNHKIHNITIQRKPLEKTSTGKIRRQLYEY
ncbi:MAG: AMP-binding protein [Oscillospiraceae bacterium]|jgi:long-chain acyl-CoA synthetase|nr:AMP-binding protein [Oscillospiraceae bacterium]